MSIRVAITIDTEHPDHPAAPGNLEAQLDALEQAQARASFFVQGRWAASHPALARRIAEAGHAIGNHSKSHAPMDMLTDEGIAASLSDAEQMIEQASGVNPRPWFRCPYGDGGDDTRVLAAIERAGYRHIGWDVDTNDWEPGRSPADLIVTVLDGVSRHGDGAIVLMHSWPDVTAAVLAELVARLRGQDAQLVGVDELG
ncbi:MAG: peptidoglycan-N-acetylglucosamine deacetylase [Gaiellales bacterium]|jgi:peptidoglycan/xylan/chitin deacetylase (PgdA/CDA1 family)|nr:peptidoglycan-N-acetylglucosamine deacetylase [Gaiellales bacterium]